MEARERAWEAERERAAAEERRRQGEIKRQEAENRKRIELLQEAKNWQDAQLIGEYTRHIKQAAASAGGKGLGEWLAWVQSVVEGLDPTAARLGSFDTG